MSSRPQSHPDYIWSRGRRWMTALTVSGLMTLVIATIRLIQCWATNSGPSTAAVKLVPGMYRPLPFAVHFGWDLGLGAVGTFVLVLLATRPTSDQVGTEECIDTTIVSIFLGLVGGLVAACLGLYAIPVFGFLGGLVRAGSRGQASVLDNSVRAPLYGALVAGLVVGALVGFVVGIPAAVLYLSANLVGAGLALIGGTLFPAKDGLTLSRRIWDWIERQLIAIVTPPRNYMRQRRRQRRERRQRRRDRQ